MELSENTNQADEEKAAQSSGEAMAEGEIAEEHEEGEEEAQEGQESQEGTQTVPTPAQTATTKQAPQRKRSARDDEPYEWEQCTVVLTIQLLPLRAGKRASSAGSLWPRRRIRTRQSTKFCRSLTWARCPNLPWMCWTN